jgi:hypothetical protein
MKLVISSILVGSAASFAPSSFINGGVSHKVVSSSSSTSSLDMKYKVAVVGGGPSGACAAEIFAKEKNVDTVLFERKMDNAKPCGGAIPLCMIGEFDIPETTVDRKVRAKGRPDLLFSPGRVAVCVRVCAAEYDVTAKDGVRRVFARGGRGKVEWASFWRWGESARLLRSKSYFL